MAEMRQEVERTGPDLLTAYTVCVGLDGRIVLVTDETLGLNVLREATQADIQMTSRFIYDQLATQPPAPPPSQPDVAERIRAKLAERSGETA